MRYSIKTVDGDRFIFTSDRELMPDRFYQDGKPRFIWFDIENGKKYFNTANIVSITERKDDE